MDIFKNFTDGQTLFLYLTIGFIVGLYAYIFIDKIIEKKAKHTITKIRLNNYKKIENIDKINFKNDLRRVV